MSFFFSADAGGAEQAHRRSPGAHQPPAGEARQAERAHQDAAESGGGNIFMQDACASTHNHHHTGVTLLYYPRSSNFIFSTFFFLLTSRCSSPDTAAAAEAAAAPTLRRSSVTHQPVSAWSRGKRLLKSRLCCALSRLDQIWRQMWQTICFVPP